jgi:hypothetical protein
VLICHVAEATGVDVAAHVREVLDMVEAAGFEVKIAVGVIA